ncbi:MAG: hypothetical protein JNK78_03685 [Planctomycetes bacterium]|nr:hypothetical protein [Planctomycetota bacterium]
MDLRTKSGPGADRWFFVGGALLVPLPLVLFAALRAFGVSTPASEDLVTLAVMLPLGGPHVFATVARTFGDTAFWRRATALAIASVALLVAVPAVAVASTFFDASIAGRSPMTLLLTGFFFWAGMHVAQQHIHVGMRLSPRSELPRRSAWLGRAVVLLALYPVSLFRMSMGATDGAAAVADPDALATRVVRALGGSAAFADDYVFRIGRATPVLPELLHGPLPWIMTTAAFVLAYGTLVVRIVRLRQRREAIAPADRLALVAGACCGLAPLAPSLDCAFQGINAWHCFQYLRLALLEHREAVAGGSVRSHWLREFARPGRAGCAYAIAVGSTLALVAAIFALAITIEKATDGRLVLFGHEAPPLDPSTGLPLYRPGSVLFAYYVLGLGLLLVHYLQDTVLSVQAAFARAPATAGDRAG